jgi:hypothetical protein
LALALVSPIIRTEERERNDDLRLTNDDCRVKFRTLRYTRPFLVSSSHFSFLNPDFLKPPFASQPQLRLIVFARRLWGMFEDYAMRRAVELPAVEHIEVIAVVKDVALHLGSEDTKHPGYVKKSSDRVA